MMSGFEITCVNKDQHGMIVRVGGEGWNIGIRDAILDIIGQRLRLYVHVDDKFVDIGVQGEGFDAYLALEPDGLPLHEVTSLPSC
jgi:hypothetical protein